MSHYFSKDLLTLCSFLSLPPPTPCSTPEIWIIVPFQVMYFLYIAIGTVEYLLYMIWSHVLHRHLFYLPTDVYTWVWVAPLLQVDFPKWKMIHIWWFISVSHFSQGGERMTCIYRTESHKDKCYPRSLSRGSRVTGKVSVETLECNFCRRLYYDCSLQPPI